MINRIKGSNYKAFKEFDFEIKPLTILLGANSCGKSALINILLMFSQTCESLDVAEVPLRLNGSRVGLGESLNIIRNKDSKNILSFSFYFENQRRLDSENKRQRNKRLHSLIRFYSSAFSFIMRRCLNSNSDLYKKYSDLLMEYGDFFAFENSDFKSHIYNLGNALKEIIPEFNKITPRKSNLPSVLSHYLKAVDVREFDYLYNNIDNINSEDKTNVHGVRYDFKIINDDGSQEIMLVALLDKHGDEIISIEKTKNKEFDFKSDLFKLKENEYLINSLKRRINFESLNIINDKRMDRDNYSFLTDVTAGVGMYIEKFVADATYMFIREFNGNNINHVSPLRAFPQRYYLLDKSIHHEQLDALNGIELAEVLKKNAAILDKINKLFSIFNIYITIQKTNDIIHRIVVNQNAVELELTDVGFGISQVLPILVQAYLSPKNSITIIEQPEIHLNPKMQAWLIDAIISISLNESKNFIIETHSETIIRRLRLRIVDQNSKLTPSNLNIYHLERNNNDGTTDLNKATIDTTGDLIWPKEFMDINAQDLLEIQKMKFDMKNKEKH